MIALLQVAVSALFAVSALLKLAAPVDLAASAAELGFPGRWWKPVLGPTIVGGEALLAVGLLVPVTAQFSAAVAAVFLAVTGGFFANSVRRGRRATCGCFGGVSRSPAGWGTVARNGVGAAAALILAYSGVDAEQAGPVAVAAVLMALAVAFVLLAREHRRALAGGSTPVAPLSGSGRVPTWPVTLSDGSTTTLPTLLSGATAVLLFTDPGCAPCERLRGELRAGRLRTGAPLIVVSRGDREANRSLAAELGVPVVVQADFEVARTLGVRGTPGAVAVDRHGEIAGTVLAGLDPIMAALGSRSPAAQQD